MKIGIDIRNIGKKRTGDEVVFFNLVKNLARIDRHNEYLLFTDRNPAKDPGLQRQLERLALPDNFKVISLGERGIDRFSWNCWTLPAYLRKNPIDIYHTQYITPFFIPRTTRIFTVIHDVSFKAFPGMIKLSDRLLLGIFIPISLRRADKIIAVSNFTAREIGKYYKVNQEKIAVIPNAVSEDILEHQPTPENISAVKEKYRLPEKFVMYLGTLQPRKNIPALIEAFAKMRQDSRKTGDIKLVLAGGRGHNYDQSIDQTIRKYSLEKDVILPGFVPQEEAPAFYRLALAFCFPSLYEGFGIPILEALALGTPVIASSIEPHKEIADGSALLFDPKNIAEFSKKLLAICMDEELRMELRQNGIQRVGDFSWKISAEKMLRLYESAR